MSLPRPDVDPDGLLEYSVVFTDRSLNHMYQRFVGVMQDIDPELGHVHPERPGCDAVEDEEPTGSMGRRGDGADIVIG